MCGRKNKSATKFCVACGYPLTAPNVQQGRGGAVSNMPQGRGGATPYAQGGYAAAPPPVMNRPPVNAPARPMPQAGYGDVPQVMFKSPTADNPAGLPVGFEELDGDTMVLGVMEDDGTTTLLDMGGTARAFLVREDTREEIPINKPQFTIGRSKADVDYCISDRTVVSRAHAVILSQGGRYYVVDLNSSNKTYVNNNELIPNREVEIQSGAHVRLADVGFVFYAIADDYGGETDIMY